MARPLKLSMVHLSKQLLTQALEFCLCVIDIVTQEDTFTMIEVVHFIGSRLLLHPKPIRATAESQSHYVVNFSGCSGL